MIAAAPSSTPAWRGIEAGLIARLLRSHAVTYPPTLVVCGPGFAGRVVCVTSSHAGRHTYQRIPGGRWERL